MKDDDGSKNPGKDMPEDPGDAETVGKHVFRRRIATPTANNPIIPNV